MKEVEIQIFDHETYSTIRVGEKGKMEYPYMYVEYVEKEEGFFKSTFNPESYEERIKKKVCDLVKKFRDAEIKSIECDKKGKAYTELANKNYQTWCKE